MNYNKSHLFSQIPHANIERSVFDRSHEHKTTFDAGYLVPFYVDEVLPGDSFQLKASIFARLATPIVPIMDNMYLETFFFYVPNRILWEHWKAMNGEQKNLNDSIDYLAPIVKMPAGGAPVGSIYDYYGIPTGISNLEINSLFLRAYNLIYQEWFKDENLVQAPVLNTGDGPDNYSDYKLLRRGKRHDYFTSCLPWPQKGPGVELPLGTSAPVYVSNPQTNQGLTLGTATETRYMFGNGTNNQVLLSAEQGFAPSVNVLFADLSRATAATINSLRQAFQIQRLFERDARGGTRYTEILRSHFGVISPDARLQRPEYLGGSSTRINVNPVTQTSSTDSTTPQGNLAAFGLASDVFHGFTKSFTEHGIILGLCCVRADLTYQQGLNRMFSRRGRFDYYWPALAHLGEQAVLNKEIYAQGNSDDDGVFGYQERWAEYRYHPSIITGQFRSTYANSLDKWHLSQKFENLPVLNEEFILENPPMERVLAVSDNYPQFIFDSHIVLKCSRPMPVYSVPGLIDHF